MARDGLRPTGCTGADRVAIVGGGAAGALLALQLAERGITSTVLDRRGAFARGVAYSATAPWHRLNVPIEKMGGWRADGGDQGFHEWLVAQRGPLSGPYHDRYVPRSHYGAWLRHELDNAAKAELVELRAEEVVSAHEADAAVRLGLAGGGAIMAPLAVLCPGNQKPRPLAAIPSARYVGDMWAPAAMDGVAGDAPVLIVGTGATGIDALLELHHRGQRGTVYMLSRRGLLPLEDAPPEPYALERTIVEDPPRLRRAVRLLRQEAESAAYKGHPWQSVVDAFRTHLPRLWSGMSEAERHQFLRHLRPYWLVHRHRLAPDIARLLRCLQNEKRLEIVRGRLRAARRHGEGLMIDIDDRGRGPVMLPVAWVINCTGPEEDFRRVGDPLISHLLASGAARPGAFGIGLDVDGEGRLCRSDGRPQFRMFVLGGATRSRFGEVTSAPQIRRRAAHLVETIVPMLDRSAVCR